MFTYEYTSPTAEQLHLRRQQLDLAGFHAWLSPAIVLLTVYAARMLHRSVSRTSTHTERSSREAVPSWVSANLRRFQWVLTQPTSPSVGAPHVVLAGSCYIVYLLYLAAQNTTNDYLHITKSLGHVAVSQLPWHYLLALKSPFSPITLATGLTHERLNSWHRTLGRIIAALVLGHAVLYLKFFSDVGVLGKRLGDWDVRLGLMALTTISGLLIGSLAVVRKKAYWKGFYLGHVVLSALLLVIVFFHMGWTRRYVLQAGLWWVVNACLRAKGTVSVKLEVDHVDEIGKENPLVKISLRKPTGKVDVLQGFVPGQHVYLRLGDGVVGSMLGRKNPFTIADLSLDGKSLTLVVRKLLGTTKMLQDLHGQTVLLEGPYGEAAEYIPPLLKAGSSAGQILLVAGGIGATYTLPIYLALLDAHEEAGGLKMVWIVRTVVDVGWAIELLKHSGKLVDIDIYVKQRIAASDSIDTSSIRGLTVTHTNSKRPNVGEILEPILSPKSHTPTNDKVSPNAEKKDSRSKPLKKSPEKLTVMLCGPPSLSDAVRREVGKHVLGYGREVKWFEEQFGFGGS